ncbi:MAG: prepilin-type N-terminal cleavage/methylation domain-containing protein [Bryobacteraceae bacterium]|nr:prepilin-type N-terminal cleavage/methylation domain-containing protein [Bryobacteraceae bacterium]
MRNERGITLIELLVAVTLLSLLSAGMFFAMQIGLGAMGRTNKHFTDVRRVLGSDRVITEQIAGFVPTAGLCQPTPEAPPIRVGFFQGDVQTMRFVSTWSLQEAGRGLPRILEFQVIPGENGEGVRLVVNETLFTGPPSTIPFCAGYAPDPMSGYPTVQWRPVQIGPNSFVLADKLAYCRFTFKQDVTEELLPDKWLGRWIHDFTPAAVRIDWLPLHPDPSRLTLAPMTLPFRPGRHPLMEYSD